MAPRRTVLDPMLAAAAAVAGAEVRYGVAFEDVLRDDAGRVTGARSAADGARPAVRAELVIGADGRARASRARWARR